MVLELGDRLRDYEVVAELDSGGMALLYLAREAGTERQGRPVAIKVLRPQLLASDASFAQMFVDEARISARIQHPNVVRVEELGEHDDTYFLVMEYIAGCSLLELLRSLARQSRGLASELAVWMAAGVAAGLHDAHETCGEDGQPLGIIHRDVNPRNILLGANGEVKLIDFGIAKARNRLAKTTRGVVKGTLRYMSPEQARGRALDRRSDVYSTGVVVWEMLTGRRLVRGKDDVEIARQLVDPRPSPPSTVRAEVDAALDAPVLRALARDPDERYATVEDLRRELLEAAPGAASVPPSSLSELLWAVMPEVLGQRTRRSLGEGAPLPPPELDAPTVIARATWEDPTLVDVEPVDLEADGAVAGATEVAPPPVPNDAAVSAAPSTPAGREAAAPSGAEGPGRSADGRQGAPAPSAPFAGRDGSEPVRLPTRSPWWLVLAGVAAVGVAVAVAVAIAI